MKIRLSDIEADKIILKKIGRLQKLKKEIKIDKNWKFIDILFQRLEDIRNITMDESDFFEDNSQLVFKLNVYTNVNLNLFSDTTHGCNNGISAFEKKADNTITYFYESPFYEIRDTTKLKAYFSQIDMLLPVNIEILKLDFIAKFENTITEYQFIK